MQSSFLLKQRNYLENKHSFPNNTLRKLLQAVLYPYASSSRCDLTAKAKIVKEGRGLSPTAKKIELFAWGLYASRLISHVMTTLQLVNND